jgi:hypothetical protein
MTKCDRAFSRRERVPDQLPLHREGPYNGAQGGTMKLDTYENPSPGKTYISPSLPAFGQKDRTVRIASKVALRSPNHLAI